MTTVEKIAFAGWPNCLKIYNNEIELIVSTDIGPRILSYGFSGEPSLLYLLPDQTGKMGGDEWRIYGGHRLWHAPEAMPRSYSADNTSLQYKEIENGVHLIQAKEPSTGISKELEITVGANNDVTVVHRLVNHNLWEVQLAIWALSVMAPGGRAIIPQEKYGEADVFLLPARPLVLWHFTKMNDPRWIWGEKYIQAVHDPAHSSEQKIGAGNSLGWIAFWLNETILVKKIEFDPAATYCDFGCNVEIYMNGDFLEMETLGPIKKLASGGVVEHVETWTLGRSPLPQTDDDIDRFVIPILNR